MGSSAEGSREEQQPSAQHTGSVATARILIAEDDQPLARFLSRTLSANAYVVDVLHDGAAALEKIEAPGELPDLVLLDLNLPTLDGLSVLRRLRPAHPKLPVLVLTARSRVEDMVAALEGGADDCLTKPFSYVELLARVRALLRRNVVEAPKSSQLADLTLNRDEHKVERNGRRLDLTPREFDLLDYLLQKVGTPVSRATLMKEVWSMEYDPTTNIVDVYMKYVRDKVDLPGEVKLIRTVRGVGYMASDEG